ncbi:HDOD domain-containing protein [Pelomonas sp. KK5]|uniref:HDOD domain-containing protein n=1 Tax=Pelomonas sp. KK5 TaxID=1855730 RepID=UPI00097CBEB0|nr:HDOD domain-containing protein [Pelomonas sp. KK5]
MNTQQIRQEIDRSRAQGALKQIVIPPCPELLVQLREAMRQAPEPDLNAVARIAAADVAMSATLLRIANGPLHKPLGLPCTTVGQAMNRIGLKQSAEVMSGFLARNAIPVNSPHLARFWERSTKRAIACGFIATQLPGVSEDMAHAFGLFLHVGMPVLLQSVRGYGGTIIEASARIDRPFIATENANHKTDHAVVGALTARAWNMPAELMAAIRLHHDFRSLGHAGIEPEVHTLIAMGLVAEQLMRRHEGLAEDADWATNHGVAMEWLHIGFDDLETWQEMLWPLLDEA